MKKTIISLILSLALVLSFCLCLCCCTAEKKSIADKVAAEETVKIGIIQYVSHPSLDNCREGILSALNASGISYETNVQIGSTNSAESDCVSFSQNMVSDGCDMIIAIATPAAKPAYTATADTKIPVVFCAVSDPVGAGLVKTWEKPGDLCTGTSDVLDLTAHVNMIRAFQPDIKTIGVIYTSSEENSLTQLKNLREVCSAAGIAVEAVSVQGSADIPAAASSVAAKSDCILNFTDNNVVLNLASVLSAAESAKIPVYGSEVEQVKNGCVASMSIDYVALGRITGEMAVEIMNGADPASISVRRISEAAAVINPQALEAVGISVPEQYKNAEVVSGN